KGIGNKKGSGPLLATALAAFTVAFLLSSSPEFHNVSFSSTSSDQRPKNGAMRNCAASEKNKFAPRFDGLRFIKTSIY
ncbi:hypothetical protein V6Z12_A11G018600, partial [Gossypium hirsutum]